MSRLTTRAVDLITNGCSAVQLGVGMALMFDALDWKQAIIAFASSTAISSFMNGKGIPTLPQILSEFKKQTE